MGPRLLGACAHVCVCVCEEEEDDDNDAQKIEREREEREGKKQIMGAINEHGLAWPGLLAYVY